MIHVLCTDISQMHPNVCEKLLVRASPERRARANRYRLPEDRRRCIAAGALLRHAAGMCGISDFSEERGDHGKPHLMGPPDFHYNLSHSGRWVIIAFGSSEVGVDVEKMDMDAGKEEIARRWFAKSEQDDIFGKSNDRRRAECFFRIWTQKESILKYLGIGLSKGLPDASVEKMIAELKVHVNSMLLEDGYCLSVCAGDTEFKIDTIDINRL